MIFPCLGVYKRFASNPTKVWRWRSVPDESKCPRFSIPTQKNRQTDQPSLSLTSFTFLVSRPARIYWFINASAALRAFAFILSTCNSKFLIFSRASRRSAVSFEFSSCKAAPASCSKVRRTQEPISASGTAVLHRRGTRLTPPKVEDREGVLASMGEDTTADMGVAGSTGSGLTTGADGGDTGVGSGSAFGGGAVCFGVGAVMGVPGTEVVTPLSRLTSLTEGGLPEKNSPAVREGSAEGAGGKMSDWKESD